jgi:hypothetical protein
MLLTSEWFPDFSGGGGREVMDKADSDSVSKIGK